MPDDGKAEGPPPAVEEVFAAELDEYMAEWGESLRDKLAEDE